MLIPIKDEIEKRRNEFGYSMCFLSKKAGLPNNAIYRIESMKFNSNILFEQGQ